MGISADQVDQQREFDELNEFGFTLLSDADRIIGPRFGAERAEGPTYRRLTFVIDRDRTIMAAIDSETDMEEHADRALEVLRGLAPDKPAEPKPSGGGRSSRGRWRGWLRRTRK